MAEYEEAWEKEYLNFNTKLEEITNYLITYKTENKYWKASTDDFEQFELSYKISDAELKD
ncbi:hypothetical protein IJU97_06415 [bacterium]|nr:hypothetical protein [bacterium]